MGYEFVQDSREANDDEKREAERGGISKVILNQKDWFNAWLEGEKKCMLNHLSIRLGLRTYIQCSRG